MPPVIRLTALGMRGVPDSIKEAAGAFGASRWQLLKDVEIPLALPSDKTSTALDVKFSPRDKAAFLNAFGCEDDGSEVSVVIWTTTPWTIPGNLAVTLHPDLKYALVAVNGERLVMAQSMVEDVMARYEFSDYQELGSCDGADLQGMKLAHPLYDRDSLMILGDYVTTDAGTGAVHTAPDHGVDDFYAAAKHDLGLLDYVDDNGRFREHVEMFGGQHVMKVDKAIIEALESRGKLIKHAPYQHSYPFC